MSKAKRPTMADLGDEPEMGTYPIVPGTVALVLYFPSREEADAFRDLCVQENPNWIGKTLP